MPSEFVDHFTRSLNVETSTPGSPSRPASPYFQEGIKGNASSSQASSRKASLHVLLVTLNQGSVGPQDVQHYLQQLRDISPDENAYLATEGDSEETALEEAIIAKLTVALYANALETYLGQATQVESEAEWWSDIESSRLSASLYLIQTLPRRLVNVAHVIIDTLRAHQLPVTFSTLSPSSLRSLFPSPSEFSLRPGLLTTTFFPHLRHQQPLSLAVLFPPSQPSSRDRSLTSTAPRPVSSFYRSSGRYLSLLVRLLDLPLELTMQECRYNRKALEQLRDQRAEVIGELAQLRTPLGSVMNATDTRVNGRELPSKKYTSFLDTLCRVLPTSSEPGNLATASSPLTPLDELSQTLSSLESTHMQLLQKQRLLRPSRMTRLWPTLLILPPLSMYIYTSYTSWVPAVVQMSKDAKETVRGFVEGWLVEPLVGVLHTVRAGGRGEVLVREEGVLADVESLQRMTVALARDTLHYTPTQLEALAEQVRMGDLTPVMQAYEEDIRTPLRSAVTGTLLRNAFIQVQKAKVDIDQALSGIDKLLKSQELTFAFVGVAPALAIVYTTFGVLGRVWGGGKGRGRWGGRKKRKCVWEGMRRIERLLINQQPGASQSAAIKDASAPLPALPTGLLILSLTRLRSYALAYLPANIREPFLDDLGDLEDTRLGKEAKLRVIDRMWRCWGTGGEGIIRF